MATATVPAPAAPVPAPAAEPSRFTLPVELTSFIGREREIAAVRELLGTTRLLTLTGAGGSGKTRLAGEIAVQAAAEYAHGIAWIELALLANPELLAQQIAAGLQLREEPGRAATDLVLDALRDRDLLLVLDNCEHLVDACAHLVDLLLRSCDRLRVLATSREALGVPGERAWLVPALSLPGAGLTHAGDVAAAEAVQLFVERARDTAPAFSLTEANAAAVAQICRRLDGIPLAIELAAARIRVLTPEQIAERLGDAFRLLTGGRRTAVPRQQTLRAAMDWSYDLLGERERMLLQRLSVFAGGFTIEAAEAVCADASIENFEVLDLISALVDRSLVTMQVRGGEARYGLLETVRQYARERLRDAGVDGGFRRRHAEFFLALASDFEPIRGATPEWLRRCEAEHDNLRAALRDALDRGDAEAATRLAGYLRWFWYPHGHLSEARRWLAEALALPGPCSPAARARALMSAGVLAYVCADWVAAERLLQESLALFRRIDEPLWTAAVLGRLGILAIEQGRLDRADPLLEEAWPLMQASGDPLWMAVNLQTRGRLAEARGDLDRAAALYDAGVPVTRRTGRPGAVAGMLGNRARVANRQGDYARTVALLREALVGIRELGSFEATVMLADFGAVLGVLGDTERSARLVGAAEALFAALGTDIPAIDHPVYERNLAAARSRADGSEWARWAREGAAMSLQEAITYATAGEPVPAAGSPDPSDGTRPAAAGAGDPAAPAPADAVPAAMPELRVCALGELRIFRDGEPLPPDSWAYARPKELLLYLLAHPKGRTREQIGLVFWPDASPVQVKNSFHVTLHHLRKALGRSEWIVYQEERYRVHSELGCEFDAALFEERITAALRQARAGAGNATPERLAAILGLYRGDFLEDEAAGDWHLEVRDRLRRLWLDGMLALGDLLVRAEGAEVYGRIVRREDLHEEAHRKLMLCWARAGERTRALKHYERLVALLQAELDVEPEAETTALLERLKQAAPAFPA